MGGDAAQKVNPIFVDWITNGGQLYQKQLSPSSPSPYLDTGIIDNTAYTYTLKFAMFPDSISGIDHTTELSDGTIINDTGSSILDFGSCSVQNSIKSGWNYRTAMYPYFQYNYEVADWIESEEEEEYLYDTYSIVHGGYQGNIISSNPTYYGGPFVLFNQLSPGTDYTLKWNIVKNQASGGGYSTGIGLTNKIEITTTGFSCYLFAVNFAGYAGNSLSADSGVQTSEAGYSLQAWYKLYSFSIQDKNDNYLINLKPCYVIEDGVRVYGAYDTITGKFLTSPNGALFKGPDDYK